MRPIAIVGHLKPHQEPAEAAAGRLSIFLTRLAELDPLFSGWRRGGIRHRSAVPRVITLPPDELELRTWVAEGAIYESREGRKQQVGYSINARTSLHNPIYADFWLSSVPSGHWFGNRIGITVGEGQGPTTPNKGVRTLETMSEVLRSALIILGTAWQCDWAGLMPGNYRSGGTELIIKYESGWMVYVDQSPARHLGNLHDIVVEKLANNGVLLTARSGTRFDPHNPVDWAAAVRIQAALAPLNERRNGSAED